MIPPQMPSTSHPGMHLPTRIKAPADSALVIVVVAPSHRNCAPRQRSRSRAICRDPWAETGAKANRKGTRTRTQGGGTQRPFRDEQPGRWRRHEHTRKRSGRGSEAYSGGGRNASVFAPPVCPRGYRLRCQQRVSKLHELGLVSIDHRVLHGLHA